jgi:hypothetical protein
VAVEEPSVTMVAWMSVSAREAKELIMQPDAAIVWIVGSGSCAGAMELLGDVGPSAFAATKFLKSTGAENLAVR